MAERLAENYLERYVETYWENGIWKSRRHDCDEPFATGRSRQRRGDQVPARIGRRGDRPQWWPS